MGTFGDKDNAKLLAEFCEWLKADPAPRLIVAKAEVEPMVARFLRERAEKREAGYGK